MLSIPSFDGRIILYPDLLNLKDYYRWRQVDCHINNLYNTTFWALVNLGKLSPQEAHNKLKGTLSKDKNEILYSNFNINYNKIEEIYKKGSIIKRKMKLNGKDTKVDNYNILNSISNELDEKLNIIQTYKSFYDIYENKGLELLNIDIINDDFWEDLIKSNKM